MHVAVNNDFVAPGAVLFVRHLSHAGMLVAESWMREEFNGVGLLKFSRTPRLFAPPQLFPFVHIVRKGDGSGICAAFLNILQLDLMGMDVVEEVTARHRPLVLAEPFPQPEPAQLLVFYAGLVA